MSIGAIAAQGAISVAQTAYNNKQAEKMQMQEQENSLQNMALGYDYNQRAQKNSITNLAESYRNAGLNPASLAGQTGSVAGVSNPAGAKGTPVPMSPIDVAALSLSDSQAHLNEAQAENIEQITDSVEQTKSVNNEALQHGLDQYIESDSSNYEQKELAMKLKESISKYPLANLDFGFLGIGGNVSKVSTNELAEKYESSKLGEAIKRAFYIDDASIPYYQAKSMHEQINYLLAMGTHLAVSDEVNYKMIERIDKEILKLGAETASITRNTQFVDDMVRRINSEIGLNSALAKNAAANAMLTEHNDVIRNIETGHENREIYRNLTGWLNQVWKIGLETAGSRFTRYGNVNSKWYND